jgi:hypothetical protein
MNTEMVNPEYSNYTPESEDTTVIQTPEVVEVNNGDTKLLTPQKLPTATESSDTQWQKYGEQVSTFIGTMPSYIGRFYEQNKGAVWVVGGILGALVTVKLTLALLDAIDDIPLVAPTLQLIGLGYTIWFIYRYLLKAETRLELGQEINAIKAQVLGTNK